MHLFIIKLSKLDRISSEQMRQAELTRMKFMHRSMKKNDLKITTHRLFKRYGEFNARFLNIQNIVC